MRYVGLFSALIAAYAMAAHASQPLPAPHFQRTAVTEDFLRQLDSDQLRLLRRAIQGCPSTIAGRVIRSERDPCVITGTDRAVADSGNPDLEAFHQALPDSERYDENRSSTVWRAWLKP